MNTLDHDLLISRLKHLIVDLFRLSQSEPDEISDDEPLLGGSLGLDSLDALELALCIEEEFGVMMQSREESLHAFASVASLASFIQAHRPAAPAKAAKAAPQTSFPALASPSLG